jgi:transposase
VCRNSDLAVARRRKREDLLAATERDLTAIHNAVRRAKKPLRGEAEIGLKVGAVIGKYKMAKHFTLTITDTDFVFARKHDEIAAEARLDGIYVIRTSLAAKTLNDDASVRAYKSLAQVERAIRSIKTVDLQIRPIFHWAAPRVRAHACLCMLAYYVEWHMRQRLAPMLYDDADKDAAEALRSSVVAKAQRSPSAVAKQTRGTTPDGLPVHSFQSLLADLATLAQNIVTTALNPKHAFVLQTRPTNIQQKAFDLLGINPDRCTQ